MSGAARCEIDGCHGTASVHVLHPTRRVCSECAAELTRARFPRADVVLRLVAVARVLRSAADELDELAGASSAYEVGTLRRKARSVVIAALSYAQGEA